MRCEICGKQTKEGKKIVFMGAVIVACNDCAVNGRIISDIREEIPKKEKKMPEKPVFKELEYEVVENFGMKIKNAREKKGLKQEEFAKHINEPVAYIKRIEQGFVPPINVIQKIERFLGINLTKKPENFILPKIDKKDSTTTLGDVAVIKKR